ncbi:Troponin I [Balamuthia mandrillaris]
MTSEIMERLMKFANVSEKEQEEWVPSLTLQYINFNRSSLANRLWEYQVQCQINLLDRVDEEQKIEWLSLNEPNLTSAIVESTHNPSYEFLNAVIEHTPPAFFVDTVMRVLRHMDFLNLDTLIEIVKKGGAEIARAVAPCLPKQSSSSASSSASAMSSSNATLSTTISQVLYTKEMQRILDNSDLFKEPLYTVSLMRALFEANRQRSDVAAFLLEALKDVLRHKEYRTGSETSSLKSITDQLLLDLCREHEFSVTAFDELITLLSSQLLCELHVYAKLGPNTTWTFLIGCLSATWGTEFQAMESEVLKQLAARSNLPTSAQWTLALHHSKVGNYREGNDLFHLMVSNGVKLDDAIIHYFLMNEPSYIQMCLQAGLLNALQTQFVVEKILPTLAKEGELPEVETYFQNFIQTVQQFTGSDIKMEDIEWGKISSETINRSITYMTAGLELRDIPNFLKDDLHLNVAFLTKVVDALSKGVRILEAPARRRSTQDRFRFGNVDNKQAMDRLQGAKGGNDGAERDAPELQLSVPITSLQLAIDHFPDLVLSFDIQHYLPEFLEQNLLVYTPRETSVEVTLLKANDELKELFPAQFLSTLNLKVKSFLSMRFSVLIEKRKKDFTKAEFIKILKEDSSELEAIHKIFANLEASADNVEEEIEEEVEQELLRKEEEARQKAEEEKVKEGESGKGKDLISPEEAERKKREAEEREAEYQRRKVWAPRPEDTYTHNARLVETLVQNGLAKAKVKDLQWMLNELIAIIKGHLRIRVMPTAQSLKQALIKFYSPTEVITTTLKNVEYIYAYRFWKLFPDLAQKSYPENIKELFLLWGPPEVFEKSTCGVIQQKIQFLLDLLDLGKKAEKEGSKPEDLSAFLQAIVSALRSDKENFILENGKLYYTCTIKPTSQDDEEDSVIHSCCMNTIEKVTLAVLSKVGKLACATIRSLSSLVAPDSNTTIVSGFSFSATVKPEAEMKQMKILKLEELEGLSNSLSTQEVKKEDATLLDLYNYLLPYQNIININDFAYTDLLSKSHSLGGHTVFSLGKVFSLEELRGFPLKELLPNLELVHYYVEEIQPQFLDRQSSIVTVENKPIDYFFNGTKIDEYCFYDDRKWREIITRLKQQFVDEHTNMLKQSLSRFHIHYVSGPDSSSTEETTEYGVEPIPGAQLAQHPMILDEDGMVTFTPEGEIARDTSKSKVIQPVYKVVVQKKHIPKLTEYDTKLDLNGGCLLPATHIRLLHASCEEYFDQLKKTLAIKFNSLSKAHMEKLIKQFESGVENGLTITIPSGTAGPGFTYTLYPIEAECEKDIEALKTKMENLGKDKLQCIKNFTISHRDTIAAELALYLSFVRDSILKDEHKFSRYCQAALCVLALQDDVNYHVMLDEANTHAIRYISDILIKLGERLFEYEEQNKAGLGATTILVMFPCHVQHVGILFVSSHYNQENGQWERFIHYNPNACAAEEYNRLAGFAPPKQLEHGVKLETIFNTGNDHNVLLTFEKHVIETTRREMDEKARDAIRRNDYHDESGLGVAKNLAHIVWTEKSGINHIKCEAAFVTASPKIPLTTRKGSLAMDVGPEEVDEMIRTLEDITLRHK